jgi:hypothetical protein
MGFAVSYFIGKQIERLSYERSVIRRREAQLGPVLMVEGPKVAMQVKALSFAELDAMRQKKPATNLIRLTERAIERRTIVNAAIESNPEVKWLIKMQGNAVAND